MDDQQAQSESATGSDNQDAKVGAIPQKIVDKVTEKIYEMLRRDMMVEQERRRFSKQSRTRR